jgi:GLPGLI family protein
MIAQTLTEIEYTFRDKNNYECKSILYIVNKESVFKIYDTRESGIQEQQNENGNFIAVQNDEVSKIFYSNDTIEIRRIPLYKNEIIYNNNNDDGIKIEYTNNKKKIGNYTCQEAKTFINGRKYSIWFTTEIDFNFSPYGLNLVPGLIIELYEETNKIKLTLKSIKKTNNIDDFNNIKKYIFSKNILTYKDYESNIIKIMTTRKASIIAKINEAGGEIVFDEEQTTFTQFLIDIPKKLISELQKIN